VVAAFGAHKSGAAGGGAGHLQGSLHRFRPTVGEERVLQSFRRDFGQATRQRPLHGVEERLAAQRLLLELIHHRLQHVRVAMPEAEHAVAAQEIEVLTTVLVGDVHALGTHLDAESGELHQLG